MNAITLESIASLVQRESLLSFSGHKRQLLLRKVEARKNALLLPDIGAYYNYLCTSSAELELLLGLLTVNETSFFRNRHQFDFLMRNIIPQFEELRGEELFRSPNLVAGGWFSRRQSVRVLCAGCSTGEEPYSVAMAFLESLRFPRACDVSILAGDLSNSCLQTARDGWYDDSRLKHLSRALRSRYMDEAAGGWRFREEVKKLITFFRFNLKDFIAGKESVAGEDIGGSYDIIFCRNVMIYFPVDIQQALVRKLFQALAPGGYLFTGDAEPLHLYEHEFKTVQNAACLIYQKKEKDPPRGGESYDGHRQAPIS